MAAAAARGEGRSCWTRGGLEGSRAGAPRGGTVPGPVRPGGRHRTSVRRVVRVRPDRSRRQRVRPLELDRRRATRSVRSARSWAWDSRGANKDCARSGSTPPRWSRPTRSSLRPSQSSVPPDRCCFCQAAETPPAPQHGWPWTSATEWMPTAAARTCDTSPSRSAATSSYDRGRRGKHRPCRTTTAVPPRHSMLPMTWPCPRSYGTCAVTSGPAAPPLTPRLADLRRSADRRSNVEDEVVVDVRHAQRLDRGALSRRLASRDPHPLVVSRSGRARPSGVIPKRLHPELRGHVDELVKAERPIQMEKVGVLGLAHLVARKPSPPSWGSINAQSSSAGPTLP